MSREKENNKKNFNLWVGLDCRLDHKLFFEPPYIPYIELEFLIWMVRSVAKI